MSNRGLCLSRRSRKTLLFYLAVFGFTLLVTHFVACLAVIHGPSMENTLRDKSIVAVWRLGYTPRPGDMVLVNKRNPLGVPVAKRVIAVSGQTVKIDKDGLWVDGILSDEPYIKDPGWGRDPLELGVPVGQVFLLGDNRDFSVDSREIGCVDMAAVTGKIIPRIWH